MKGFLKNYAGTIAMLGGVLLGGVCGALFPDAAHSVKPIGDIFLNLMITLVVPLVFFSISSSVCKLSRSGSVARVLGTSAAVFIGMSLVAAATTYIGMLLFNPLDGADTASMLAGLPAQETAQTSGGQALVSALTVSDFPLLFSRSNLLPLIIFTALLGAGVSLAGEKGEPIARLLDAGTDVMIRLMDIVMLLAPVGLGCYFADTIASLGSQILGGYLRSFVLITALVLIFYFLVNPAYVMIAGGRKALRAYWQHILPPSITALATASSAAAMPGNIDACKKMGVRHEIAESVVPLGTNLHKDGSVVCSAVKVAFLMLLFGGSIATPGAALSVIGMSILAATVTGAVASGGMTGELLICTMLGVDPRLAGVIIIIATITDIPDTLLNSSSNVVAAVLVDRFSSEKKA